MKHKLLSIIAAIALVAAIIPANTFANSEEVVDATGVPEGAHLMRISDEYDNSEIVNILYGFDTASDEEVESTRCGGVDEEDEEALEACQKAAFTNFYEKYGLIFFHDYDSFHLEDDNGEEIPYQGDGITIPYRSLNPNNHIWPIINKYSDLQWEFKIAHIKSDRTVEYLPVEISGNTWTFTTTSLSTFAPVAVAIKEEEPEPVKTLDSSVYSIGIIAVSLATLATFGLYLKKSRR